MHVFGDSGHHVTTAEERGASGHCGRGWIIDRTGPVDHRAVCGYRIEIGTADS